MASNADQAMYQAWNMGHKTEGELLENFDKAFSELYVGQPVTSAAVATNLFLHPDLPDRKILGYDLGQEDFRSEFRESGSGFIDQTHHFATYFSAGLNSSKADILYALTRAHRARDNSWLQMINHLPHYATENFDPGADSVADYQTLRAWQYFTGQVPMPTDFFSDVFDTEHGRASFRGTPAPDGGSCDCK